MELSYTVEFVVDVEVVDEFGIDTKHTLGKVGVNGSRFEQADVQRSLANATSLLQSPAHHLTCSTNTTPI